MISGYGIENLILEQAGLPNFLPVIPYYDHGWSFNDQLSNSFLKNPSIYHFTWNKRIKEQHKVIRSKKIFITGSPFIYYKKKNLILKKRNKNLIFFFSHSTPLIKQILNMDALIDDLKKLPRSLQPVDICIHDYDVKQYKSFFLNNGFEVFSPGPVISNNYAKNFYNILSNYSYSCSNTLGSFTLYSLDLDIPFFLIGQEPIYDNFGNDKNVTKKFKLSDYNYAKKFLLLFKKFNEKITDDQKAMAIDELGEKKKISSKKLRAIILQSLLEVLYKKSEAKGLIRSSARNIYFFIKSLKNFL